MIKFLRDLFNKLFGKFNQFFFVGSSDILPPPLEKEEEITYLIKAQQGDISARNKLIEHNLRLVVFIAKKYESNLDTLEDLVSIGSIGLIKGINTYKIDKNIRLATYASRCISNEILMHIRKNKKRGGDVSFEEALTFDGEGNELHLEDIIGTDEDIISKEYEKKIDIELLKKLAENGQVATQYVDLNGVPTMDVDFNPNGSVWAIEGITSPDGRCFGKMAHSERRDASVAVNIYVEQDLKIFESGVAYFRD